jgi:DNA-binding IclR family transcriptional regulator
MKQTASRKKPPRSKAVDGARPPAPAQPSIGKALAILDLFDTERYEWTADDLCAQAKGSRPTVYRYIRELVDVGLLRRIPGGRYALGPKVIRLDKVIRRTDPLLRSAVPTMHELTVRTACTCVLTALFGREIMDMHSEHGDDSLPRGYGRGQPVEMFRGSAAKIILSQQPVRWQKRLYATHAGEIARVGMASDWVAFAALLAQIRKDGYYISRGEVTPSVATLAVPIDIPSAGYSAALSIVTSPGRFDILNHELIIAIMRDAVKTITDGLGSPARPDDPFSERFDERRPANIKAAASRVPRTANAPSSPPRVVRATKSAAPR